MYPSANVSFSHACPQLLGCVVGPPGCTRTRTPTRPRTSASGASARRAGCCWRSRSGTGALPQTSDNLVFRHEYALCQPCASGDSPAQAARGASRLFARAVSARLVPARAAAHACRSLEKRLARLARRQLWHAREHGGAAYVAPFSSLKVSSSWPCTGRVACSVVRGLKGLG